MRIPINCLQCGCFMSHNTTRIDTNVLKEPTGTFVLEDHVIFTCTECSKEHTVTVKQYIHPDSPYYTNCASMFRVVKKAANSARKQL